MHHYSPGLHSWSDEDGCAQSRNMSPSLPVEADECAGDNCCRQMDCDVRPARRDRHQVDHIQFHASLVMGHRPELGIAAGRLVREAAAQPANRPVRQ